MEFLGASDSAVPCAMLLSLVQSLEEELKPLKNAVSFNFNFFLFYVLSSFCIFLFVLQDISLELWFFDGEEAFVDWGPHDSIYGARHLAKKMEKENSLSKIVSCQYQFLSSFFIFKNKLK